jgi:hypothetical protein
MYIMILYLLLPTCSAPFQLSQLPFRTTHNRQKPQVAVIRGVSHRHSLQRCTSSRCTSASMLHYCPLASYRNLYVTLTHTHFRCPASDQSLTVTVRCSRVTDLNCWSGDVHMGNARVHWWSRRREVQRHWYNWCVCSRTLHDFFLLTKAGCSLEAGVSTW